MPQDLRIYLDAWPAERKLVIDRDVVVIFTYSHPAVLWDQTASLHHVPSMSRVGLNSDGKVAITHYGNKEGRQTLERYSRTTLVWGKYVVSYLGKTHRHRNQVGRGGCLPPNLPYGLQPVMPV